MNDWFRSWHGAPTDPKWLVVAKNAGVAPGIVSAVVWALFDHASQAQERGSVSDFDFETYATFSGFSEEQVRAVYVALEAKRIILSGRLSKWGRRQPKREDPEATERVRQHRGKRGSAADAELPLPEPRPPPPEIGRKGNEPVQGNMDEPPLISPQAVELADQIAVIAGHNLAFVPPAWCGAASRVHVWLANGWQVPLILESVKAQIARKRDGPPDRIQYFEKGIARAHAQADAPLPTVKVSEPEVVHVTASPQSSGGIHALRADLERRRDSRRAAGNLRVIDGSGDS